MMFIRASACTRAELQRAFDEYAEAHTLERATEALERSTGARDVASVPEHRIVNALTELICGFSFVGQQKPAAVSYEQGLAAIHEKLAAIRDKAYARQRTEG